VSAVPVDVSGRGERQLPVREGIYVVIAAYNESGVAGNVVRELRNSGYAAVLVDDGSSDDTALQAGWAGAIVLRHAVNRGQGAALQSGIRYALDLGAQIVVTFDADGQHCVTDLPRLVAPVISGTADVVLGSRFLENAGDVPMTRRILLRAAVLLTSLTSGVKLTDAHNGMRAFSRAAAATLDLQLDRMAHASEIIDQLVRGKWRVVEVPVRIRYTSYSRAKGQRATDAAKVAGEYFFSKLIGRA
jgi:polyprenyl-phospho-N-acetylgalactosaminyl synthase